MFTNAWLCTCIITSNQWIWNHYANECFACISISVFLKNHTPHKRERKPVTTSADNTIFPAIFFVLESKVFYHILISVWNLTVYYKWNSVCKTHIWQQEIFQISGTEQTKFTSDILADPGPNRPVHPRPQGISQVSQGLEPLANFKFYTWNQEEQTKTPLHVLYNLASLLRVTIEIHKQRLLYVLWNLYKALIMQ